MVVGRVQFMGHGRSNDGLGIDCSNGSIYLMDEWANTRELVTGS